MDSSNFAIWVYRGITVILLSISGYVGTNVLQTIEQLKTNMDSVLVSLKYQDINLQKLETRIDKLENKVEFYKQGYPLKQNYK